MATYTEQDIKNKLNERASKCAEIASAYEDNKPVKTVANLVEELNAIDEELNAMGKSFYMSNPDHKIVVSDDGTQSLKPSRKTVVKSDRFIEDLIAADKDRFLAIAPQVCNVVKKAWDANPIEGFDRKDYEVPDGKGCTVTITGTNKMIKGVTESINSALDSVNASHLEGGVALVDAINNSAAYLYRGIEEYRAAKRSAKTFVPEED